VSRGGRTRCRESAADPAQQTKHRGCRDQAYGAPSGLTQLGHGRSQDAYRVQNST